MEADENERRQIGVGTTESAYFVTSDIHHILPHPVVLKGTIFLFGIWNGNRSSNSEDNLLQGVHSTPSFSTQNKD